MTSKIDLYKGKKLRVTTESSSEHPFRKGEEVKVFELIPNYFEETGVVWVKNKDNEMGCLTPSEYEEAN
jgi:hypothetical protein